MPTSAPDLALYHRPSCGYCRYVLDELQALGVRLELRDVGRDRAALGQLLEARGRATVPVLRIDDPDGGVRWMPESEDIVRYLKERFSGG